MGIKEQGLSVKQMKNAYRNYVKRYNVQRSKMARRGLKMYDEHKLTYSEYKMNRRALVEQMKSEGKRIININQTIASTQQYEFSLEQAKGLRKAGEELDLELSNESILQLRSGRDVRNEELSLINNALKDKYPDMTGTQRAKWITDNIFYGSL